MIAWPLRLMRRYGPLLAAPLLRVLRKMARYVTEGLDAVPDDELLFTILRRLDVARWSKALRDEAGGFVLSAVLAGAAGELKRIAGAAVASRRLRQLASQVTDAILVRWRAIVESFRRSVTKVFRRPEPLTLVRKLFSRDTLTSRANRIAEIDTHSAIEGGREVARRDLVFNGFRLAKVWSTMLDNRVRDAHERAEGQTVPMFQDFNIDGSPAAYPGDPRLPIEQRANCILPGHRVRGRVEAATRSVYSGKVIEIIFRSGRRLSVTPNHPILTGDGWTPAGGIQRGQQVLACNREVYASRLSGSTSGGNDVDNVPPTIQQVFQSLMLGAALSAGPTVEVTRRQVDDFHGDGQSIYGDIEIVRANGVLLENSDAGRFDEDGDSVLALESVNAASEPCCRSAGLSLSRVGIAAPRIPRRCALPGYCRGVALERSPFSSLGVRLASQLNASFLEGVSERPASDSGIIRELIKRNAGLVATDEVWHVRDYEWKGHVYDLQCTDGVIQANGIIISNCRCVVTTAVLSEPVILPFVGVA